MCRALTQMKGYDAAAHVLACFGGAGGQHACAIATALGMKTIFVHRCAAAAAAATAVIVDSAQFAAHVSCP
jgi:5-oxoprolinase (ATP-hydrolysing)